jgi:hypothetical protein
LDDITAIELIPRTPGGRFWLLDISARGRELAAGAAIELPRISIGDLVVAEGDSGEFTVQLPVTVDGEVKKRAQLWVQLTDYADMVQPTRGFPLVLEPGATSASVSYSFTADDIYNPFPQLILATLLARRYAVTGDFDGTLLVKEDDPPPELTVDASHVTAAEGASLTWTLRLSEPLASGAFWSIQFLPAAGRFVELDTDDVPASFLENFGIVPPDPAVPLSELGIFLGIEFAPGAVEASFAVPLAADGAAEPAEGVVLLLDGFGDPVVPEPIELTGEVPAG